MPVIPKSIASISGDPKAASAMQRLVQSQVSQIERKVGRAESAYENAQSPGMDASKELRRFKTEYQNIERAKRELEKLVDIPDKLARTISKLAKSFTELNDSSYKFRMKYLEGPKQPFGAARRMMESGMSGGDRASIKSGFAGLRSSFESSKESLKELKSSSKSDAEMVSLLRQLVSDQKQVLSGYRGQLAAPGTTPLAGGRGGTVGLGYAGTTPLPAGYYGRYGISAGGGAVTGAIGGARTTGALGYPGTTPLPPSYYARMGVAPTPSRVTTPFGGGRGATGLIPSGPGTRALTPTGGYGGPGPVALGPLAPTVPLGPAGLPPLPLPPLMGGGGGGGIIGKWGRRIFDYEAAKWAYHAVDRTVDKGDEAYINAFEASRRLGSDVYYGHARGMAMDAVTGMGMHELTTLMGGGTGARVGEVNRLLLSEGYGPKEALEMMAPYGRFGGLRTAARVAGAYSRDRTAGFMSGSEWSTYAGRLADLGYASDIGPGGLDSRRLGGALATSRQFIGSLGAAMGSRGYGKDTAMTMWNTALDIGSRGNIGSLGGLGNYVSSLATSGLTQLRTPEGIGGAMSAVQGTEPNMWQRPVLNNMMLQMYSRITGGTKGTVANWGKFMKGMGGSAGDLSPYLPIMKDWEKEGMPLEMQMLSLGNMNAFPIASMSKGLTGEFTRRGLKSWVPLIMGSSAMMGSDYSTAAYATAYKLGGGMLPIPESPMDKEEKNTMERLRRRGTREMEETSSAAGFSDTVTKYLMRMVDLESDLLDIVKRGFDWWNLPAATIPALGGAGPSLNKKELEDFYKKHPSP